MPEPTAETTRVESRPFDIASTKTLIEEVKATINEIGVDQALRNCADGVREIRKKLDGETGADVSGALALRVTMTMLQFDFAYTLPRAMGIAGVPPEKIAPYLAELDAIEPTLSGLTAVTREKLHIPPESQPAPVAV